MGRQGRRDGGAVARFSQTLESCVIAIGNDEKFSPRKSRRTRRYRTKTFPNFVRFASSFENTSTGTIWQRIGMGLPSYRRKPVSIPSRPCMPACAGMTNQERNLVALGRVAISYSVDERKLMN